jgi:peptidoglycan-N-acetylmuramic acid deacetylase
MKRKKRNLIPAILALAVLTSYQPMRLSTWGISPEYDVATHGYGQGIIVDNENVPIGAKDFTEQYKDIGGYALTPEEGRIILTFDCGYENGYTEKILDTLKAKNVTGIFFLTGDYAKKETALVNRMIDDGHMLGNHGMTHASLPKLDKQAFEKEVMTLHNYIKEKYSYEMSFLRPPCGEFSEQSVKMACDLGYKTIMWSASHVDWKLESQPEPTAALAKLTKQGHSGAIYLIHTVSTTNADILGDLIDNLRKDGFRV